MLQTIMLIAWLQDARSDVALRAWQTVQMNGMLRHLTNYDALVAELCDIDQQQQQQQQQCIN